MKMGHPYSKEEEAALNPKKREKWLDTRPCSIELWVVPKFALMYFKNIYVNIEITYSLHKIV